MEEPKWLSRTESGDRLAVSVPEAMVDYDLKLSTHNQTLGYEDGLWVIRRVRSGKVLGVYHFFAFALLMLLGEE
jgi:hypothetical protein